MYSYQYQTLTQKKYHIICSRNTSTDKIFHNQRKRICSASGYFLLTISVCYQYHFSRYGAFCFASCFLSASYPYVPFKILCCSGSCCSLSNTPLESHRNTGISVHKSVPCLRSYYAKESFKIKGSSPYDCPILT